MKIFALHAYYGAVKNVVKNLCLLDEKNNFFPNELKGRTILDFFKNEVYPAVYKSWGDCEIKLKSFEQFGIKMEIGDVRVGGLYPEVNPILSKILKEKNFIIPVTQWATVLDLMKSDQIKFLGIAPTTDSGLNWQVRAYTMKYGSSNPEDFNFTFPNKEKITEFISRHGEQVWREVNICNFYDIAETNRQILLDSGMTVMPMELVIWKQNWSSLVDYLNQYFDIEIPKDSAIELLEKWSSLHWPTETTNDWEYRHIFKEFRTKDLMEKLSLCDQI